MTGSGRRILLPRWEVRSFAAYILPFSHSRILTLYWQAKKIESRFSRNKCAPFEEVRKGDIILIKEVSGPICGVVLASRIWYFDLDIEPIDAIRRTYGHSILADDSFWLAKEDLSFATLIELERPSAIEPLDFEKRDRRGWVSLRPRQMDLF